VDWGLPRPRWDPSAGWGALAGQRPSPVWDAALVAEEVEPLKREAAGPAPWRAYLAAQVEARPAAWWAAVAAAVRGSTATRTSAPERSQELAAQAARGACSRARKPTEEARTRRSVPCSGAGE